MKRFIIYSFLSILFFTSCNSPYETADLIIHNGNIWTANSNIPTAEAMAVVEGKIVAVGTSEEVMNWKGTETEMIDAEGRLVTPGFIDCHVHFLTGGRNLASVQLRDAKSPEEFAQRIIDFAKTVEKGTWILGGDWDHENWGGELPLRSWIDEGTPDHPVMVNRLDGHMALVNSKALELAGVDDNTPDLEGGEIVRDSEGQLTGVLKDNAMGLVGSVVPDPSEAEMDRALAAAMNYVAAQGVTSVHHVGGTPFQSTFDAINRAKASENLITRVYAMMPLPAWADLAEKIEQEGTGDEWVKIGGLKGFVDGSLGSHTAAFHEPYTDAPGDKGIYVNDKENLVEWIQKADAAGLQIAVHAIGDEAIHFLLNTFESVRQQNGARDRRFRIEHAQHIAPEDIPRFAALAVIPSMQPYHAIDDGRWAEKLIGPDRIKTTYAFKSLFDADAKVAFGSDWFVAPPTPLEGIYGAVTRRTLDGKNPDGWVPEQKITVEQALQAYTINAAYAAFDEKIKGSLEPGKLADFVVLSEDLFSIDPEKIWEVKVLQTFVGGKRVYSIDQ